MEQPERRRSRRFSLQQSAIIQADGVTRQVTARTHDVSLTGMLLFAQEPIPHGSQVEVQMRLQKDGLQAVSLRASGSVVRNQPGVDGGFEIAIAFAGSLRAS